MLDKARGLAVDEVIVDLEDSVRPEQKDEARQTAVTALSSGGWAARSVTVRVNAPATEWCRPDVGAVVEAGKGELACLVVPKVEDGGDLEAVDRILDEVAGDHESGRPIGLEALIETAAGLQAVDRIAEASPRLEALILGPADLAASLGLPEAESVEAEEARWHFARWKLLVAARSAGCQAIDGPFLNIDDADGLRRSAAAARVLGYDGKWALHPRQVDSLHELFTPTAEEVDRAAAVVDALRRTGSPGAQELDGEMIDEASLKRADQLLARARAAEAMPAASDEA